MHEVWILSWIDPNPYDQGYSIIGLFSTAEKALRKFEEYEFSKDYPILSKDSLGNITINSRVFNESSDYYSIDKHIVK